MARFSTPYRSSGQTVQISGSQDGKKLQAFVPSLLPSTLPMRSSLLASFLIAMLLTSCAFEGVVVEKRSWPLPDASSIGTEGANSFVLRGPTGTSRPPITVPVPQFWTQTNGIYTFLLRDQPGFTHSQMVTAEVFARYRVGDYFNDRQLPSQTSDSKDKTVAAHIHCRQH